MRRRQQKWIKQGNNFTVLTSIAQQITLSSVHNFFQIFPLSFKISSLYLNITSFKYVKRVVFFNFWKFKFLPEKLYVLSTTSHNFGFKMYLILIPLLFCTRSFLTFLWMGWFMPQSYTKMVPLQILEISLLF